MTFVWESFVPVFDQKTKNERISLWSDVNFVLFFSAFRSKDLDNTDDIFSSLTINDPTVLDISPS